MKIIKNNEYLNFHVNKNGFSGQSRLTLQNDNSRNKAILETGFTLIEVLVSAAILVILASGFVGLQYILSQNQVSAWRNFQSIESANQAVSVVSKELRNAQSSELGSYPLNTANDQSIIFYSDYDFDGVVERVRYTLTGTKLDRGIVEPTGSPYTYNIGSEKVKTITDIVRNGTSPLFYYYNADWPTDTTNNPLTAANRISDTRQVKIILVTNPNANDSAHNYTMESEIKVRMFNQLP